MPELILHATDELGSAVFFVLGPQLFDLRILGADVGHKTTELFLVIRLQ